MQELVCWCLFISFVYATIMLIFFKSVTLKTIESNQTALYTNRNALIRVLNTQKYSMAQSLNPMGNLSMRLSNMTAGRDG